MLEFIDFGFIPEERRIFTYILISLAFVLIACAVHYKIADCCDMGDFLSVADGSLRSPPWDLLSAFSALTGVGLSLSRLLPSVPRRA